MTPGCHFMNYLQLLFLSLIDRTPQQIQLQQSLAAANLVNPSTSSSSNVVSVASSSSVNSSGINDNDQPGNESEQQDPGMILPGPRQLTTNPGVPSTNPTTGMRQRRVGVSGPPSGV